MRWIVIVLLLPTVLSAPYSPSAQSDSPTSEDSSLLVLAEEMIKQVAEVSYWDWEVAETVYGTPPIEVGLEIVRPDSSFSSQCDPANPITTDTRNAFFCDRDLGKNWKQEKVQGVVIVPLRSLLDHSIGTYWDDYRLPTRLVYEFQSQLLFLIVVLVAHELGHAAVDDLEGMTGHPEPYDKNSELLADCLAGEFMRGLDVRADITGLDKANAQFLAYSLGHYGDELGDGAHGTPDERRDAFLLGFAPPDISHPLAPYTPKPDCFTEYWPKFPVLIPIWPDLPVSFLP